MEYKYTELDYFSFIIKRFLATVYPMTTYLQYPEVKVRRARIKILIAWFVGIMVWLPAIVIIR